MPLHKYFRISSFMFICTTKAINPEEEALIQWKSTLIHADSLSSWSFDNSTCSWFGITCDAAGHVTELNLPNSRLNGILGVFYSTAFQNLTRINLKRPSPQTSLCFSPSPFLT
jgi:hypothetical protein